MKGLRTRSTVSGPASRQANMKSILAVFALLFLAGCEESGSSVKTANGETPVRYVICNAEETNCFLAARFKDLSGCESHKNWADMLCDRLAVPGQMTCKRDTRLQVSVAYCTL